MELGQLLDSSALPVVTALLLGIQTAICPCPMSTNIAAIGFIGREIENRKSVFWKGILYALGTVVAYAGLAYIVIPIIRGGLSIYKIEKSISEFGSIVLPVFLILFGLAILFGKRINLPSLPSLFGGKKDKVGLKARSGYFGSFLLGIVLSLAFCPTTGLLYFGMLLPMSALEPNGYIFPVVYALAAGLPVVILAWIMAFGLSGVGRFFDKVRIVEKWLTLIVAIAFIGVGIYFGIRLIIQ